MRNMAGNGKTGTKTPGSSLGRKDRQRHSKLSKRVGQISSKGNRIEETVNKEQMTGSASQQAHWAGLPDLLVPRKGLLSLMQIWITRQISDSTRSADTSESSKQNKRKRPPCVYGTGCYR